MAIVIMMMMMMLLAMTMISTIRLPTTDWDNCEVHLLDAHTRAQLVTAMQYFMHCTGDDDNNDDNDDFYGNLEKLDNHYDNDDNEIFALIIISYKYWRKKK